MSEEQNERDWSALPSELLHLIAQELLDLVDFIRLRAVCSAWRSSVPLSDPPQQFPWLLELFDRGSFSSLRRKQRFYSVCSGQILMIPLTKRKLKLQNFVHRGVYSAYLPFAGDDDSGSNLLFFNPLTKDHFSLPSTDGGLDTPWMVWTGSDPVRNRTIVVDDQNLVWTSELGRWAFYDRSVRKWVEHSGYYDHCCCYWQGMFFFTCIRKDTEVFDVQSRELLCKIPPPKTESIQDWLDRDGIARRVAQTYLVVSSGVILRVIWFRGVWEKMSVEESVFHIYRLDFERAEDKSCWDPIGDIGDQILFLGKTNGFSMTAKPSIGFKKGCIYFIDPNKNKPYMHDVLAGTVERLPSPFEECAWFLPGL
ncbi:F-box protein (DUF295) [Rhynchospora pubera]|uniref:F-box protein (DUF295) n=1 Tax=Rhynchospora pubera TaxID=906938 RepID=A0AAV8DS24_9POAL|nr:F-box protein (DUF295) [Rhynchospora pubera]